jgi:hypothetical protein
MASHIVYRVLLFTDATRDFFRHESRHEMKQDAMKAMRTVIRGGEDDDEKEFDTSDAANGDAKADGEVVANKQAELA